MTRLGALTRWKLPGVVLPSLAGIAGAFSVGSVPHPAAPEGGK